jgi:hypothetical protein
VVILIINHVNIAVFELKSHASIAIDPDRPTLCSSAFERVQMKAGNVHIFNRLRSMKRRELNRQTPRIIEHCNSTLTPRAVAKKFLIQQPNGFRCMDCWRVENSSQS